MTQISTLKIKWSTKAMLYRTENFPGHNFTKLLPIWYQFFKRTTAQISRDKKVHQFYIEFPNKKFMSSLAPRRTSELIIFW